MPRAFSERAEFDEFFEGIGSGISIDRVIHQAFIETNEAGSEAAAATAVGVGATSLPPSIDINRPFVYFIREQHTGTLLFAGTMLNPAEN